MNFTIILYTLCSFVLFFLIAKISNKLNFVDLPDKRKIHTKRIVYTGGTAISVILILSVYLFDNSHNPIKFILFLAFLISLVGFIDDKFILNAVSKLSLQIIPIIYLIFFEKLTLKQLGDYDYFQFNLGVFGTIFTLICVLFLINSFNYFDGIDGLLSFTTMSTLAILFFLIADQDFRFFLITILIPISLFLCFNFSFCKLPKMFLGDSGSLLLGFVISFILIYLSNKNLTHPILLAWSVVIFVYEFLSINLIRFKKNIDLFRGGQDHLHHLLLMKTNSVFFTSFLISSINIILFITGYLCFTLVSSLASLILFIFLFIIFFIFRNKYFIADAKISMKN